MTLDELRATAGTWGVMAGVGTAGSVIEVPVVGDSPEVAADEVGSAAARARDILVGRVLAGIVSGGGAGTYSSGGCAP